MDILILDPSGLCENCIVSDSIAHAQQFYPGKTLIERTAGQPYGPGWTYSGGVWTAPAAATSPRIIGKVEYLKRIPQAQRIAIRSAVASDVIIADAIGMLDSATEVNLDDPDTVAFVAYLVSKNYLTAAQQTALLE